MARSMKVFSPSPPMADAARDFSGPAEIVFTRMPNLKKTVEHLPSDRALEGLIAKMLPASLGKKITLFAAGKTLHTPKSGCPIPAGPSRPKSETLGNMKKRMNLM